MTSDTVPELERYRITSLPEGLYYISQFVTPEEARSILDKVSNLLEYSVECRFQTKGGQN